MFAPKDYEDIYQLKNDTTRIKPVNTKPKIEDDIGEGITVLIAPSDYQEIYSAKKHGSGSETKPTPPAHKPTVTPKPSPPPSRPTLSRPPQPPAASKSSPRTPVAKQVSFMGKNVPFIPKAKQVKYSSSELNILTLIEVGKTLDKASNFVHCPVC